MVLGNSLTVSDELNFYLTICGLKPASEANIWVLDSRIKEPANLERRIWQGKKYLSCRVNQEALSRLKNSLHKSKVPHQYVEVIKIYAGDDMTEITYNPKFYLGSNYSNLRRMREANNCVEAGLAYGFPKEAVDTFTESIDGEVRDATYVYKSLVKAKKAGVAIPSWLAYISFAPSQLDIVNGKVCDASRHLGESYERFVKENNPGLAFRAEQYFFAEEMKFAMAHYGDS